MSRLPRAATKLLNQMDGLDFVATYGEPDGLNVVRTLTFSDMSEPVATALKMLAPDPRIQSVLTDELDVVVTFVADRRADDATEFPVRELLDIVSAPVEVTEDVKPPSKKPGNKTEIVTPSGLVLELERPVGVEPTT